MGFFKDSRVDEVITKLERVKKEQRKIQEKFVKLEFRIGLLREDFDAFKGRREHSEINEVKGDVQNIKSWIINISEFYDRVNQPLSSIWEDEEPTLDLEESNDSET